MSPTFSSRRRKRSRRGRLLALLLLPLLLLGVLGAGLAFLVLDSTPLVPQLPPAAAEDAVRARAVTRKVVKAVSSGESAELTTSAGDLNSFLTIVSQGIDRFSGRIEVAPEALLAQMTLRLPSNPAGGYLNLRFDVLPSDRGLEVDRVQMGGIAFPAPVALFLLKRGLDLGVGLGEGDAVLDSVASVSIDDDTVRLRLQALSRLRKGLRRLGERVAALRDEIAPLGGLPVDPEAVRLYLGRLRQTDGTGDNLSLADYVAPLFYLAQVRSSASDPVAENRAALLAMAIHLGDRRFAHLVGIDPPRKSKGAKVVLGGRRDLRLHFVVSAGLKLMADQGTGFAVGEIKELLDTGRGGSGFSFVDLAADRAGVRFAAAATSDPRSARRMQRLLAGEAREELFFPPVSDLPENLSQGEFDGRFGHVGSSAYRAMVKEIDARLSRCPVYQADR